MSDFKEDSVMDGVGLSADVWQVYLAPKTFPDVYFCRRLDPNGKQVGPRFWDENIKVIRGKIYEAYMEDYECPPIRIPRDDLDDLIVVETWI